MDRRLTFLNHLRYFETAAKFASYSRAADELCVTQAAVSQKLRQLEQELGCKLFIRKGRDMVLTSEGRGLYEKVSQAFDIITEGLNATQPEPVAGVLCVATTPSIASRWLIPRLWKFSIEHADIPIRISSSVEPSIELSGDIDIAIGELRNIDNNDSLIREHLFNDPFFPVCSPELANSLKLSEPEQLLKCWLIKGIRSHHFSWETWFKKAGVDISHTPFQWMEVETLDMGLSAVMAGHGVCAGTDSLAGDFIERGLLVKPFDIEITPGVEYSATYHRDSIRKARISVFVNWLKKEAKAHQPV